jgi:hypothetical protein
MSFAQTFGNTLQSLNIDTSNTDIPSNTAEILSNVLGNLQSNNTTPPQKSTENFKNDSNTNQNSNEKQASSPQSSTTNIKTNLSIWKIIKISAILVISFIILSTEFLKNLVSKVTNNHIISMAIFSSIFFMISFISIKWSS